MKRVICMILVVALCCGLSGCSLLDKEIANRKSEREECVLNELDASLFTYDGTEYRILEDTVDRNQLGSWVGYIQKYAVLDEQYAVLKMLKMSLTELKSALPDTAIYLILYLNIYNQKDSKDLIIDVDGGYHKAVPQDQAGDAKVIEFKALQTEGEGQITVHEDDCTQIWIGNSLYQITDVKIGNEELGEYIGVLAVNKVFDTETKMEISRDDLIKIEIEPGELSKQKRSSWTYGMIYSISGTDQGDAIAVQINNEYLRADVVQ